MIYEKQGRFGLAQLASEQSLRLSPEFEQAKSMHANVTPRVTSPGRIYINTEYGNRDCQIVIGIDGGRWYSQVINNSDTTKISCDAIETFLNDFLNKEISIGNEAKLRQNYQFSLKDFSISLFNWRDLLCGRVDEIIADTENYESNKLGAFGFLAGKGHVAAKPVRLKFIELAKLYPEKFEYLETDKFGPQMENQVTYTDYKNRYKYIIDLPGHHFLTKLYWMLFTRRTLFYVPQDYTYNWEKLLKPYEHYIPLNYDLSNLVEQYEWAESHPEEWLRIHTSLLLIIFQKHIKVAIPLKQYLISNIVNH